MTTRPKNIRAATHEATLEGIERLAAMLGDESIPKRERFKAANRLIHMGWGKSITWRDWVLHPIRTFRLWRSVR